MTVGSFCNDDMLHNLITIGSMDGQSNTSYRVPAFFSRILHLFSPAFPYFINTLTVQVVI